ncbi:MAG TPA: ribosome small subunit-dependent GTPase A [Burkholderiales bacterium]|nr:ribosome small subunit-dependent GTPase A [Burkholderiales bacterium]
MARPGSGKASREPGTVVAAYGRRYRVELQDGEELDCVTRSKKTDVACGDAVGAARTGDGVGVIEAVEPRRTLFYRSDARRQKLIAANVTQVIIVVAAEPPYSEELVDRCLVAAEHAGIGGLIAFNKIDLPRAGGTAAALELYRRLGYRVAELCAKRDLAPLRVHLGGHTSVLVGQSGMGKSTIINGLLPQAAARVAEISAALGTGRHTTTHAELYHLDAHSHIIDSPGLQEFGLHHLTQADAAQAFLEFRPWLGQCRFRDCTHTVEPDCAITAAAVKGEIAARRLASYRRLVGELQRKRPAWDRT